MASKKAEMDAAPAAPEVAPEAAAPEAPAPVPALRIVGPEKGFRRAGRSFELSPTTIPLSELTEKQIEALRGERKLAVMDVTI